MEEAVGKELSGVVAKAQSCARFNEYNYKCTTVSLKLE